MHSGAEPRNERSRVFGALDKFDPLQELAVNYLWDKRRGGPWERKQQELKPLKKTLNYSDLYSYFVPGLRPRNAYLEAPASSLIYRIQLYLKSGR